jgi:spermidine synthase
MRTGRPRAPLVLTDGRNHWDNTLGGDSAPVLSAVAFLSGAGGLIYEVVWTRLLADALGSTALAMTCVFSVFMVALAVGALLVGRWSVPGPAALALYAWLELGIALTAALTSAVLLWGRSWIAVRLPQSGSLAVELAVALLATSVLIGLPVLLMGGTLPAISNAVPRSATPRAAVVRLYGMNTLGAATGTLAAGFFLIWSLGLMRTLAVGIALNVLAGLVALALGRRRAGAPAAASTVEEPVPFGAASSVAAIRGEDERGVWMALAFLSGFSILGYEMLWGRMAKFLLGDRTIAISALLFVFISGLGLASLGTSWLGTRLSRQRCRDAAAWAMLTGGLLHLLLVPLASATAAGGGLTGALPLGSEFARRVGTIWLLVVGPILALGLSFPLLMLGARQLEAFPGRTVGRLYFVNTVGAALGAAAATFALSRWLGTLRGFLALTAVLVVASGVALAWPPAPALRRAVAGVAIAVTLAAWLVFPSSLAFLRPGETQIEAAEDEYGVQVLASAGSGRVRVRNNRLQLIFDLGSLDTSHAQQMAAHLTMMLAAEPHDVINIGTGYGITAGAFTLYDSVRSIETVEILPFLVTRQALFARHNFGYWADHRVDLRQGDGRHFLLTSGRAYDIISVNVLDPYLPGSSALYTTDFYRAARARLRAGGVLTQLLWGSDVDLLVRGLRSVFPEVLFFPAYGGTSLNAVAFRDPVDRARLRLHLERLTPAARRALSEVSAVHRGPTDPEALMPALLQFALELSARLEGRARSQTGPLHTDDLPVLEYRWAHGSPTVSVLDSPLTAQ